MATAPNYSVPANVDQVLQETARTYRQQLLRMPTKGLAKSLKYMTLRPGIRVSETVGEITGDAQFGPYDETRISNSNVKITPRTLRVFLGSVIMPFSPNSVYSTIWGANETMGDALKNVPIAKQVLDLLSIRLGVNLNKVLFTAVRNDQGTLSKDLFNGFDTIAKTEFTSQKLTEALGNLCVITDAINGEVDKNGDPCINKNNVIDVARAICEAADENLMDEECFLYVPKRFKTLYEEAYTEHYGSVPYNKEYHKSYVTGYENVKFAPLSNKKGAPFFQLTTKSNMLVGVNETQNDEREKLMIDRNRLSLEYIATKFFGCEYESINKERILFATIDGATPIAFE